MVKDIAFNEFWIHGENKSISTSSGGDELSDWLMCDEADGSKRMAPFKIMLIKNTSSESPYLISSKLIGFGNPFHIECLKGGAAVVCCAGMNVGNMIQDEKTEK